MFLPATRVPAQHTKVDLEQTYTHVTRNKRHSKTDAQPDVETQRERHANPLLTTTTTHLIPRENQDDVRTPETRLMAMT